MKALSYNVLAWFVILFLVWIGSIALPKSKHMTKYIDLPEEIQAAKVGDSMVLYKQDTVYFLWFYHHGDMLPKSSQLVIVK